MAADKNIKVTPEQLARYDKFMTDAGYKYRTEIFDNILDGYEKSKTEQPPEEVIKYVDRIVYKSKAYKKIDDGNDNQKAIDEILLLLRWLDLNTAYFPTHHSNEVKKVRDKIRDWLKEIK